MSSEPTKKQAIAIGIVAIVLGAGTAAAIYLQPQALNAPAWVAYAAVATFPLAGAAPDLACRVGFGLGSLLCLFFLVLLIRASLGLGGPSARERHD
jgi:hypothetical protein